MFAAALLASLLAQAEQAPVPPAPEPTPGTAIPAAPAPAERLAPPSPAPPPPSLPAPAPAPPPGVVAEPAPIPPPNSASVYVRYAYRVGNDGDGIVPASGLSLGGEYERRLRAFETGVELGAAIDFFYDRFTKDVIATGVGPMGDPEPAIGTRTLSQTTFALMETTG